jgi:RNA polymerase sigma-70 factor (ECF subfamily)
MEKTASQFERYYHESKDKIFTFLVYRVNFDKDLAEDLLMEIFLKAFERFDQFDIGKGPFEAWIYTIARNHLYNYFRDNKQQSSLELMEEETGFVPSIGPEDVKKSTELDFKRVQIFKALDCVSQEEKDVIVMKYIQEIPIAEIARIIDRTEGAARTFISRAMNNLRSSYIRLYPNDYE